ncbi:MAG: LarC family nickel insertion protein [Lachnospiraceae bacterium]|nr:LarC family nickel insertion protein [Lachnospiraceae bacterium]
MAKSLYFECASGISGDMTVAALLDLGADEQKLRKVLDSIPAEGFSAVISRVKKSGIDCMDFDVRLDAEHENHDHDMEYLYGHEHDHEAHDHEHSHEHHDHDHHDHHDHDHHEHGHHHRHLVDVLDIIDRTDMSERARGLAGKIFGILAQAEAKAHGIPVEEVHFHEVGAIDSIVDIIAAAVCFDDLTEKNKISDVIVKSVTEGTGTVRCQHGVLPVPVPAVTNIAAAHALPLRIAQARGEFVTPTGAAFLAAVCTSKQLPEGFRIERAGLGAGKREHALPGFLRVMIIDV